MVKQLIQARIAELDQDLAAVVKELQELRDKTLGTKDLDRLDCMAKQILTLQAGRAELANLLGLINE